MRFAAIPLVAIGLCAAASAPALATITFFIGNNPQPGEELILFADQAAAAALTGVSNVDPSNVLGLGGSTTTGNLLVASSGHVAADSGFITSLTITPSSLLEALILNPTATAGTPTDGSTITYTVVDNSNSSFTFTATLGVGSNFLTITAVAGEAIQSVSISDPLGIADLQNFRAVFLPGNAVPEPATWAMMIMGFAAMEIAVRRSHSGSLSCKRMTIGS